MTATSEVRVAAPPHTARVAARWTLWFATAYTIVILVHEAAHAVAAYAQGLDATLFHFWVNFDRHNVAAMSQRAICGAAGPVSSLLLGAGAWLGYKRARPSAAAVPLLFLAACGISNFFGNLMSAAFIGDFSNVAVWLGLPMAMRYAASGTGAIVVACVLFVAGHELRRWMPPRWSRMARAGLGVVIPVSLGTVLVIVLNQPVAIPGFGLARAGEAAFWVFATVGAAMAIPHSTDDGATERLIWPDVLIALAVVALVRLLVGGVVLRP